MFENYPPHRQFGTVFQSGTTYFLKTQIRSRHPYYKATKVAPTVVSYDYFGQVFETFAVRNLKIYAETLNGRVYNYRDKNGLECDAVIHLRDDQNGLVEVILGGEDLVDDCLESFLRLAGNNNIARMKRPRS